MVVGVILDSWEYLHGFGVFHSKFSEMEGKVNACGFCLVLVCFFF